jgi:hypothetical protein
MIKKVLILLTILAIIFVLILSCSSDSENPAGRLAGTWTITTTPTSGTNHGSGSFDITYDGELELFGSIFYLYSGNGTLGGQSFYIIVNEIVPAIAGLTFGVDFRRDSDVDMVNLISCAGTTSGNSANGAYEGASGGAYDGDTGTFVATKQ